MKHYWTVLSKENRLEAALGTVNAGLMGLTIQLDEFIEGMLASSPKTVDRVQKLLPSIQAYLQATRRIDRFAQVELRVAALRKDHLWCSTKFLSFSTNFLARIHKVVVTDFGRSAVHSALGSGC